MSRLLRRSRSRPRASAWLSGCYFWYFAAVGCLGPYITVYYRHLRFTGFQIGVLAAILPLGIALIAPLSGTLADTFSAHRLLVRVTLIFASFTAFLLGQAASFIAFLLLMIVLAVSLAAIPMLLDSFAMVISAQENVSFGQLRVWGSVGYILSVWLLAWLMGAAISNIFLIAYGIALLMTCASTLGLPPVPMAAARQTIWQGMSAMVHDRSVALLLFTVYLVTSNATILMSYLSLYILELGGTAALIGAASVVAAISEMPVMVFGQRLLNHFSSRKILALAVSVYLIRFLCYSIPLPGSLVLVVQLLHGLSFGLYLMSSVMLVHELAGRERAATAQGVLSSTSLGFGAITGALVGGVLLDRIGAVGIFRVAAGGMLLALGVCLFTVRAVGASQTVYESQPTVKRRDSGTA